MEFGVTLISQMLNILNPEPASAAAEQCGGGSP
jgi:hypothetical protein